MKCHSMQNREGTGDLDKDYWEDLAASASEPLFNPDLKDEVRDHPYYTKDYHEWDAECPENEQSCEWRSC